MNNIKPLPPFKGWVIQNFPFIEADFDAITNYQLYSKVVEYLNKVIANENELTTAMNYVLNYFNNLDVQEEINNKLDEMAESGELTDIIVQYIDLNTIKIYNTVTELINDENLLINQKVKTLGYYEINDGGGASYIITNQNDTKYQLETKTSDLYAELIIDEKCNILTFGGKNKANINDLDNSFDNAPIIRKALNYIDTLLIPNGDYKVSSTINVEWSKSIIGDCNTVIFVDNCTLFNLVGRNTIKNLHLMTKENNPTNATVITETPTFITGILSYSIIDNVNIGNAFIGLDLECQGSSAIKNIKGLPLKYGIKLDNSVDIVYINNVDFNPNYYGKPSTIYLNYLFNNAYGLYIGKADWGYVNNIFVLDYCGLVYTTSGSKIGGSANNFIFNNFGCDGCKGLFNFEHNGGGFKFVNGNCTFYNPYYDEELNAGLNPSRPNFWCMDINLFNDNQYETPSIIIENVLFYRTDYNLIRISGNTNLIFKNNIIKNAQSMSNKEDVSPIIIIDSANANPIIDSNTFLCNVELTGEKQGILNNINDNAIVTNNRIVGLNQGLAGDISHRAYYQNNNTTY